MARKKGKVVLISPNIKGMDDGVNRVQPAHGVGLLAGALKEGGHEVFVRDTAMEGYHNRVPLDGGNHVLIGESNRDIKNYLSDINPDVLGISIVFSNLIGHAHTVAKIAKEINPEVKVVIGGNHVTCSASDYLYASSFSDNAHNLPITIKDLEDPNIDFGMRGECDYVFADLVDVLLNNENPYEIDGLIYRNDNNNQQSLKAQDNGAKFIVNRQPIGISLGNLPHEAREIMNMEGYFDIGHFHSANPRSKRVLNVMASRGCPEKCTFCTTPEIWGSKLRWRSAEHIYEEIASAKEKYDIGEVQFDDDSLTAHKKNLEKMCDLIEPLGIQWCTPNGIKVNYQKGEKQFRLFKRMKESGCYQITLAGESGVQRVLDDIVIKNLRLEEIKPAIENGLKAGLLVHTYWIVGYPGETREEMEKTVEFAANSGADSYSLSILSPLPSTPIYRKVMRENLWWEPHYTADDLLFRNSLINVDGFDGPQEFETWVDEKNMYLNNLLKERDPSRFKEQYGAAGTRFLKKRT